MPYVATINSNSPQALEVVEYLKTFDFVKVTKEKSFAKTKKKAAVSEPLEFSPKERKLQKKINQGLKELQEFRAGKMELQELNDFLNEI